jgi:metallo-beta-lactamase class B
MKVKDGSRQRHVVIIGSPNVNPGYKLVDNTVYPEMTRDFEKTFAVLKSLPVDYFLGSHGSYFDLETKYPRMKAGAANVFIDSEGYKNYVADREGAFRRELAKQSTKTKSP